MLEEEGLFCIKYINFVNTVDVGEHYSLAYTQLYLLAASRLCSPTEKTKCDGGNAPAEHFPPAESADRAGGSGGRLGRSSWPAGQEQERRPACRPPVAAGRAARKDQRYGWN